jgi:hypothetical protein
VCGFCPWLKLAASAVISTYQAAHAGARDGWMGEDPMSWVTWKMLVGDKSKYFAILFGIGFAFLIAEQSAIFCG